MELWVRSQNKEELLKVEEIHISLEQDGFVGIWCYGANKDIKYYLGHYTTKERASEVLDEIQKFISEGGIVEFRESRIVGRMESYKKTVYEMPKE